MFAVWFANNFTKEEYKEEEIAATLRISNIAAGIKFILDGLVAEGVIKNDG